MHLVLRKNHLKNVKGELQIKDNSTILLSFLSTVDLHQFFLSLLGYSIIIWYTYLTETPPDNPLKAPFSSVRSAKV